MSNLKLFIATLFFWLLLEGVAVSQEQFSEYPFLIITDYDGKEPEMTDSLFNSIASGIQFKVNRTEVNRQSPFFKTWDNLLKTLPEGTRLRQLYLRGAASPEGSYKNNQRLGKARTDSLLHIIQRDLVTSQFDSVPLSVSSVTEDYPYLVTLMEQAKDPDYETVRSIVEQHAGDEMATKRALMKYQNGKLWRRMLA